MGVIARAVRAVALDVSVLRRRRDLRLMTIGYPISLAGSEFAIVALAVQAFADALRRGVGLLGLAEFARSSRWPRWRRAGRRVRPAEADLGRRGGGAGRLGRARGERAAAAPLHGSAVRRRRAVRRGHGRAAPAAGRAVPTPGRAPRAQGGAGAQLVVLRAGDDRLARARRRADRRRGRGVGDV